MSRPIRAARAVPVHVSIDQRERNTAIPHLIQLEYALETWTLPRKRQDAPEKSRARLDVYRAMRSAGEMCSLRVFEIAILAGVGVRETQKAIRDLEWLKWCRKRIDVSASGGFIKTSEGCTSRAGNFYVMTRPDWAWSGKHHKHLWKMAQAKGIDRLTFEALCPDFEPSKKQKKEAGKSLNPARGAQPAPLRRKQPFEIKISEAKKQKKEDGKSLNPARGAQPAPLPGNLFSLINRLRHKREQKPQKRIQWPSEAKAFSELWARDYKFPLFPNEANIRRWEELIERTGSTQKAFETAKNYLSRRTPNLIRSRHPLAILLSAFQEYQPLEGEEAKVFENSNNQVRPKLVAAPGLIQSLLGDSAKLAHS